jgi:hypothetical protein
MYDTVTSCRSGYGYDYDVAHSLKPVSLGSLMRFDYVLLTELLGWKS